MKRFSFAVAAATALGAAAVALAGTAAATPTEGASAGGAVKELQAKGYNVQINGSLTNPLSTCAHGIPTTAGSPGPNSAPLPFTTVYVDVLCPGAH